MFSSFKTAKKEVAISYKCVETIVSTANYKEDKTIKSFILQKVYGRIKSNWKEYLCIYDLSKMKRYLSNNNVCTVCSFLFIVLDLFSFYAKIRKYIYIYIYIYIPFYIFSGQKIFFC